MACFFDSSNYRTGNTRGASLNLLEELGHFAESLSQHAVVCFEFAGFLLEDMSFGAEHLLRVAALGLYGFELFFMVFPLVGEGRQVLFVADTFHLQLLILAL